MSHEENDMITKQDPSEFEMSENKVPSAEEIIISEFEQYGNFSSVEDVIDELAKNQDRLTKDLLSIAINRHTRLHLEALAEEMKDPFDNRTMDMVLSDYLTKNKLDK